MDRVETVKNNSVNVSYPTLKQRYFSADSMTIDEILSNYTLKVPEYQRNYVWDKNNWNALIQSIEENEKLNLGSIILYINDKDSAQQPKVASIVDGQQRLTTIFTLLNCLDKDKRDAYQIDKANEDENIKKCKEYMNKYVEDCTNGKFNIAKLKS